MKHRPTVAAYYFGNYHPDDARNVLQKGEGWSEWELVKQARPRFVGHYQPRVPLWGYENEADPAVMTKKIACAADHGVDAFIFDWYWYNDGPFLEASLERGFKGAANNHLMKFALMWANHDWIDIHPYRRLAPYTLLYPGVVTPDTFAIIADHVIQNCFLHPCYWKIEGKPYFSIYDLSSLLQSFGSVSAARAALDWFRDEARAAGLPGIHLNAVVWGQPVLPVENVPADPAKLVADLGFDSVTSYVWIHHVPLHQQVTPFESVRDAYFQYWDSANAMFQVPYFPNVSVGWDSSPRADQRDPFDNSGYPFTNTIGGNTPQAFKRALEMTRDRIEASRDIALTINCWNEWTEGSYLEPDELNGYGYLQGLREVFGVRS
jgi:Glycosyltransferase WbsX